MIELWRDERSVLRSLEEPRRTQHEHFPHQVELFYTVRESEIERVRERKCVCGVCVRVRDIYIYYI